MITDDSELNGTLRSDHAEVTHFVPYRHDSPLRRGDRLTGYGRGEERRLGVQLGAEVAKLNSGQSHGSADCAV